jgi:predicted AAA+ superfamily ATPase
VIIIHDMVRTDIYPRFLAGTLAAAAAAMPVVVITGARQTGKSTLVREMAPPGERAYRTLDDLDVLDLARRTPEALVDLAPRMTLDEVQRMPELLLSVKRAVDRRRVPGQFFLTGSANLLLMKQVSDSLAGRATYLTLWPMTRREQVGLGSPGLWSELLAARDVDWPGILDASAAPEEDWTELARRGGYPTPALALADDGARDAWFAGYVRTYLERDLQELTRIEALPDFRRLMRAAAHRLGQLINQSDLSRDIGMPHATVYRWLNLLDTSYELIRLEAYAVNRTKRLIKAPKLYWADTGLAMHLAGEVDARGAHLENIVLSDLLAWRDAQLTSPSVLYWRTASGEEVDFVIEAGDALLPIEVKTTTHPRLSDARHLLSFRTEYGTRARAGLLLHCGTATTWLTRGILATPWWTVV